MIFYFTGGTIVRFLPGQDVFISCWCSHF